MTYFTGSTNNITNCAKDFMETILHPKLLSVGFTYIEEVVGPSTNTTRVYKSSLASNGVGDWYLIVQRTADNNTAVAFGVCEEYDSVGHLAKKWAPTSVIGGQTLPADRSHYTTAGTAPVNTTSSIWQLNISATSHAYIMSLNTKRVVISTKVISNDYSIYVGLYEPMLPGIANHFPLCVSVSSGSTSLANTGYTREPGSGTSVATGSGNGTFTTNRSFSGNSVAQTWDHVVPVVPSDGYYNKPTVCRLLLPPSQSKGAGYRGLGYGVYGATNVFAWGDIANIDWNGTALVATCITSYVQTQRLVDQAW